MKDNIFKQFCESIDYNTYNRIQNILKEEDEGYKVLT